MFDIVSFSNHKDREKKRERGEEINTEIIFSIASEVRWGEERCKGRQVTSTTLTTHLVNPTCKHDYHASRSRHHVARHTQHATRNTQHATRSTQHAARSTQHAARSTQHAARSMNSCKSSITLSIPTHQVLIYLFTSPLPLLPLFSLSSPSLSLSPLSSLRNGIPKCGDWIVRNLSEAIWQTRWIQEVGWCWCQGMRRREERKEERRRGEEEGGVEGGEEREERSRG